MKEARTFEYSPVQRALKRAYRKLRPVPRSPWTQGPMPVESVSEVHLVPPEKLISFFGNCVETLGALRDGDVGQYLEFGVFNGSSIGSMYLAAKKVGVEIPLFGFDSFEGLPQGSENEDSGVWKQGDYQCSFEEMERSLLQRGINPHEMHWIKGLFQETLTSKTAEVCGIDNPGIVFVDCDTYSSSKAVLDFVAPLITKPTIVCLDDWKLNDLDLKGEGEYKSFNEFLLANPHLKAESIPSYNRKSRTFLVSPV